MSKWFLFGAVLGFIALMFRMRADGTCCGGTNTIAMIAQPTYNEPPLQSQCYVQAPSQFVQ